MIKLLISILLAIAPASARAAQQPAPRERPRIVVPDPTKWTLEQRLELNYQARLEKARRCAADKNILGWGKALFPDKFPADFCSDLHGYLVETRNENFTNTEAPRGHAKTTIKCFLIPIFQALEEPNAYRYYLNVQATDDKALAINRSIKLELETNRGIREIYGNQVGERWTDAEFVLRNGIVFRAASTGQSIRGLNYRNLRPDYILVDDLYNEDDLNNPESTQKKNAWFFGTLYKTKAVGRRTSLHVIGTAVNAYDLMAILAKDQTCRSKSFKAVLDDGALLWPAIWIDPAGKFTADQLVETERSRMGSLIWAREMQNERWDEASAIVKRSWLEQWEYDPITLIERIRMRQISLVAVLMGVDPSIGKKLENDDTAMVVVWKTIEPGGFAPSYWIHYAIAEHMSLNQRIAKMQAIGDMQDESRRVTKCLVEAISGFQDFADEAKSKVTLPIVMIDKVKDKISNLMNKSAHFESGRVHLSKNVPRAVKEKIVHQLTTNYPDHDDLRDAILLCLDSNAATMWDRLKT